MRRRCLPMIGHVILSHGLESGPDATKVTALAAAAAALGWTSERPDYLACDRAAGFGRLGDVAGRITQLCERARAVDGPLVLAGSSLGAYICALASLARPCAGLFLLAPPPLLEGHPPLRAAAVPTCIVHGWRDELIPVQQVIDWAQPRRDRLLLVDDDHRLSAHVGYCADRFVDFLRSL